MFVRGVVVVLMLLMVVIPTSQLMSPASANPVHQLTAKTAAKVVGASRIPAVTGATAALDHAQVLLGYVSSIDVDEVVPGFSAAPFVPPRA